MDAPENAALVEAVGIAILNPRRHYEAVGQLDAYLDWVARMKDERCAFLNAYDVDQAIIAAVLNV